MTMHVLLQFQGLDWTLFKQLDFYSCLVVVDMLFLEIIIHFFSMESISSINIWQFGPYLTGSVHLLLLLSKSLLSKSLTQLN